MEENIDNCEQKVQEQQAVSDGCKLLYQSIIGFVNR